MAKYTLPVATENILGGVKIGNGIDVTQDGVISIKDYSQMKEDISFLISKTSKILLIEESYILYITKISEISTTKEFIV